MIEKTIDKDSYRAMVARATPKSHIIADTIKAFFVGGAICAVGQAINMSLTSGGVGKDDAGLYTSVLLILAAVFLTSVGVYDRLSKFGGAGTLVPITGFANAVASPALEFKKEGFIYGVGARMFAIAGPVIVYGAFASAIVGLVHFIILRIGG